MYCFILDIKGQIFSCHLHNFNMSDNDTEDFILSCNFCRSQKKFLYFLIEKQ